MLLDLIYPPVCGICGKINKKYLCKKCEKMLKPYEIYSIIKCNKKYFDYRINILKYENIIRKSIIDYKFNEKPYMHKTFEKIILKNKKICRFLEKYDIIIYVPMYKKKKSLRGYNQSELIAKDLAKGLNIKFEKNNLIKIVDTNKQSTLTKNQRKENIKNAFHILKPEKIKGKKVILFDDIYTTGNTANECSRMLKRAEAKEIVILTLSTD